jgi:hypothetical protein
LAAQIVTCKAGDFSMIHPVGCDRLRLSYKGMYGDLGIQNKEKKIGDPDELFKNIEEKV